jgi:formiminoglutamase
MNFNFLTKKEALSKVQQRDLESKIGEKISYYNNWEAIGQSESRFVIFGIPEDIGIRANFGQKGASAAWSAFLDAFLNIQANGFLSLNQVVLAGNIITSDLMERANLLNEKKQKDLIALRSLVEQLDERVYEVVSLIVSMGKIPIVIGGGHNNAFPIISALKNVLMEKKMACLNLDPHADYRPLEGRHSGNAFSYAMATQKLDKYAILGLHENYNSGSMLNELDENEQIDYVTFEDIFVSKKISWKASQKKLFKFIGKTNCGLELDMDSILNFPVSAINPSGISPIRARNFVYKAAQKMKIVYFHLPEAAPSLNVNSDNRVGKLLAFFVTDFLKGKINK